VSNLFIVLSLFVILTMSVLVFGVWFYFVSQLLALIFTWLNSKLWGVEDDCF